MASSPVLDPSQILLRNISSKAAQQHQQQQQQQQITNNSSEKNLSPSAKILARIRDNNMNKQKQQNKGSSRKNTPAATTVVNSTTSLSSSSSTASPSFIAFTSVVPPIASQGLLDATSQLRSAVPVTRNYSIVKSKESKLSSSSSSSSFFLSVDLFSIWGKQKRKTASSVVAGSKNSSSSSSLNFVNQHITHIAILDEAFVIALSTALNNSLSSAASISCLKSNSSSTTATTTTPKTVIASIIQEVNDSALATAENFVLWGRSQQQNQRQQNQRQNDDNNNNDGEDEDDSSHVLRSSTKKGPVTTTTTNVTASRSLSASSSSAPFSSAAQKIKERSERNAFRFLDQQRQDLVFFIKTAQQKIETLYLSSNPSIGIFVATPSSANEQQNGDLEHQEYLLRKAKIRRERSLVNSPSSSSLPSCSSCFLLLNRLFVEHQITHFSPSSLLGILQFPALKKLSLSSCGIRTFSTLAPVRLLPSLEHLNLEGNPICELCVIFSDDFSSPSSSSSSWTWTYRAEIIRFFAQCGCCLDCSCGGRSSSSSNNNINNVKSFLRLKSLDGNVITTAEKQRSLLLSSSSLLPKSVNSAMEEIDNFQNFHHRHHHHNHDNLRQPLPTKYLIELFQTSVFLNAVAVRLTMNDEFKHGTQHHISTFSSSTTTAAGVATSKKKSVILRRALRVILLLTSLSRCPAAMSPIFDDQHYYSYYCDSTPLSLHLHNETCLQLLQTKITKQLQKRCFRQMKMSTSEQVVAKAPTWSDAKKDVEEEMRNSIDESVTVIAMSHIFGSCCRRKKSSKSCAQDKKEEVDNDDDVDDGDGGDDEENHKPLAASVVDICKRWPNLLPRSIFGEDSASSPRFCRFVFGIPLYPDFFFSNVIVSQHQQRHQSQQQQQQQVLKQENYSSSFARFTFRYVNESILAKFPRLADAVDLLYAEEYESMLGSSDFNNQLQQQQVDEDDEHHHRELSPRSKLLQKSLQPLSSPGRFAVSNKRFFNNSDDNNDVDDADGADGADDTQEGDAFLPMVTMPKNPNSLQTRRPLATLISSAEVTRENSPLSNNGYQSSSSPSAVSPEHVVDDQQQQQQMKAVGHECVESFGGDEANLQLLALAAEEFHNCGLLKKSFLRWLSKWCANFEETNRRVEFLRASQKKICLQHLFEKWIWRKDKASWMKARELEKKIEQEAEERIKQERELFQKQNELDRIQALPPLAPPPPPPPPVSAVYSFSSLSSSSSSPLVKPENAAATCVRDGYDNDDNVDDGRKLLPTPQFLLAVSISNSSLRRKSFKRWKLRFSHRMTNEIFKVAFGGGGGGIEESVAAVGFDPLLLRQNSRSALYGSLYSIESYRNYHYYYCGHSCQDGSFLESNKKSKKHETMKSLEIEDDIVRKSLTRWRLRLVEVQVNRRRRQQNREEQELVAFEKLQTKRSEILMRKSRRRLWKAFAHVLRAKHVNLNKMHLVASMASVSPVQPQHQQQQQHRNYYRHDDPLFSPAPSKPQRKSEKGKTDKHQERKARNKNEEGADDDDDDEEREHKPSAKAVSVSASAATSTLRGVSEDLILLAARALNESLERRSVSSVSSTPSIKTKKQARRQQQQQQLHDHHQDLPLPPPESCDVSDINMTAMKDADNTSDDNHRQKEGGTKGEQSRRRSNRHADEDVSTITDDLNALNSIGVGTSPTFCADAEKLRREEQNREQHQQEQQRWMNLRNINVVLAFHKLAESMAKTL